MKLVFHCLLFFVLFSPALKAEDHTDASKTAARTEFKWDLPTSIVSFLTSHFSLPEDYLREFYVDTLPAAIEKALKGDEEPVAKLVAKLMGVVNTSQIETIVKDAEEMAKGPREGVEVRTDDRFLALMDRLVWAGKLILKNKSKEEKAQKFNIAFSSAFEEVRKKKKVTNEKLKQAAEGVESAKKWVRENVNQSAILNFAEGQKKSGRSDAAERVVGALSTVTSGKERVLDMVKGKEPKRLFLGKDDASLKASLDGFFDHLGGFNGARVASRPHSETPAKSWYLKEGKIVTGDPKKKEDKPDETKPFFEKQKFDHEKVAGALKGCILCHGPDATKPQIFPDDLDKSKETIFKSFGIDPNAPTRDKVSALKEKNLFQSQQFDDETSSLERCGNSGVGQVSKYSAGRD